MKIDGNGGDGCGGGGNINILPSLKVDSFLAGPVSALASGLPE